MKVFWFIIKEEMNLNVFFLILFLIFGKDSFSQDKPTAAASFLKEEAQQNFDSLFKKMSKIPALDKRIKECQEYYIENRGVHAEGIRLSKCVWDGNNEDGQKVGTAVYLVAAHHPAEQNMVSKIAVISK